MSCKRIENRLIAYMDGRATVSDRRAVESHLKECTACRARVEGFEGVWGVLNEMPVHEPSPAFEARLRARLVAEPQREGFWAGFADILPAPRLALAIAFLAAFTFWQSSRPVSVSGPASSNPSEADFRMIQDLPVLENYDVLTSFDAPSQTPAQPASAPQKN
jgi:anti-sigma factor RsiW